MKTADFYYDLPEELIAQDPLAERSSSRLMVLDRESGEIQHKIFKEIIDELNPEDCLVINDTKVIPGPDFTAPKKIPRPHRSAASEAEERFGLGNSGAAGEKSPAGHTDFFW